MSGGRWNYQSHQLADALETISNDNTVKTRWPALANLLATLGPELAKCEHDMDWDISGDTIIHDDVAWERDRLGAILSTAMKAAPDEWFPRGKWATIQAVKARQAADERKAAEAKADWETLDGFDEINGRDCSITLEPRPPYCDRGNWMAKIEVYDPRALHIDVSDCWPRYYFDLDRAKLEIEAWLRKRNQWL